MLQNSGLDQQQGTPSIYSRKEAPNPINHERSEDWLMKRDQPRNNKGQLTFSNKNLDKETDLNSILEHHIGRRIRMLQYIWRQASAYKIDNQLKLLPEEKI